MPNLFVSYARADKEIVQTLMRDLQELGYDAFYDQNLSGGQRWWDVLLDKIQAADGFLPVLTSEYRQSEACHRETMWAQSLNIPFVPIDIGQASPDLFEKVVAEANWVSYSLDDRASIARLARALAGMPKPQPPSPLPQRPPIPISYFAELEREIRIAPTIPLERQFAIIATLRAKLNTREDGSARIMLGELRNRTDITYSNAVDIERMLAGPVPVDQPPVPPADTNRQHRRRGADQSQPPNHQPGPAYQQQQVGYPGSRPGDQPRVHAPAPVQSTSTNAPSSTSLLRYGTFGVGVLLILLALFAVNWFTVSAGSQSASVNYATVRDHAGESGTFGLATAYFAWLGYLLTALVIGVTATCLLVRRRPTALIVVMIAAALLNVLITIVATVGELNRLNSLAADSNLNIGYGAGLFLMVIGVVLVAVAGLIARRTQPRWSPGLPPAPAR